MTRALGEESVTTATSAPERALVRPGIDTTHIALSLYEASAGDVIKQTASTERLAVLLSGDAVVSVDGRELGILARSGSVFDGPGDALYLPPDSSASLTVAGPARLVVALAAAAPSDTPAGQPRVGGAPAP